MPVSIVRRYAVPVAFAATVLALVVFAIPRLIAAATPVMASPAAHAPGAGSGMVDRARLDAIRLDLPAGSSEARYRAQEVLSGRGFNEAVGRTSGVQGAILMSPDGGVLADQSKIVVDLTTLKSDSPMRDGYIQRNTLQTGQYPTAEFVVTGASGLPSPLPTSGSTSFELVGDLTVHGVTRSTTWQATATFDGANVVGTATTTVLISDFGMDPPKAGPVLSIEDSVKLELDVKGTVAPSIADLLTPPS
ncbi:MAG: YceI family protein [Chloroflexota bacterium]